jgi:hypothetical protein
MHSRIIDSGSSLSEKMQIVLPSRIVIVYTLELITMVDPYTVHDGWQGALERADNVRCHHGCKVNEH